MCYPRRRRGLNLACATKATSMGAWNFQLGTSKALLADCLTKSFDSEIATDLVPNRSHRFRYAEAPGFQANLFMILIERVCHTHGKVYRLAESRFGESFLRTQFLITARRVNRVDSFRLFFVWQFF